MITTETDPDFNKSSVFNLELFFELSQDLLCIAGYDGYFKRINPTVSKVLGYTQAELFEKPISDFIHPDDRDITASRRINLLKEKPLLNFENRYITKSGDVVWLSWTSMPVEREKVVFAIAKNITHKKKIDEDRDLMLANFTQQNHELKQLTYTTSHDLRAPVSNLLSVFNLLDESKIRDEETLEFIGMLKKATGNLYETLNRYVDILNQQDSLNVPVEEVDLSKSLDNVLQSLSSLIKNSDANVHADFSKWKKVLFNKTYMESIFLNLVTNSIKYAKPDVPPNITIYTTIHNGLRQLVFADNGVGFNMAEVKDKIFGLNQHFHNNADSKGIGLYLVYNQIVSMGGSITVDSDINDGAKFTITFKA